MLFNQFRPVDGRIVFLDTEFTTLDRGRREVWEIGAIVRDPGKPDVEVEWQIRPDLSESSPDSLRIARYYRRCRVQSLYVGAGLITVHPEKGEIDPDWDADVSDRRTGCEAIAATLAPMLDDATVVAAVPSADELALEPFLTRHGQRMTHHYRLRCIETAMLGYLLGRRAERLHQLGVDEDPHPLAVPPPPYDPKEMSRLVGVPNIPDKLAHRAIVDARWDRDIWDAIHGTSPVR